MPTLKIEILHSKNFINMKPIIGTSDYKALKTLIANCPAELKTIEIGKLYAEIERAEKVEDHELGLDIIRLNSKFEVEDTAAKKAWSLKLTLPQDADVRQQKLSVFSPLGVALLGFKKGMTIQWELPGGLKNLKILNVVNS